MLWSRFLGSRGAQGSPSLWSCVSSWIKNLVCTKAPRQSGIKEIFPEPAREVGPELKQINLYFIMPGLGFFVFRSALGSLGSPQPRPTFTFKCASMAERRNFCSLAQTSLPAEAALSSASLGLFCAFLAWLAAGRGFAGFLLRAEMLQTWKV